MRLWVVLHILLLLLASTSFTIITFFIDGSWQLCFFQLSRNSGFGTEYVSKFSTPAIWAYILTCIVGAIGYGLVFRSGKRILGSLGMVLCLIGLASFGNELFQLSKFQYYSRIAFSPVLMLVLAVVACVSTKRTKTIAKAKAESAAERKALKAKAAKLAKAESKSKSDKKQLPGSLIKRLAIAGSLALVTLILTTTAFIDLQSEASQPRQISLREAAVHWPDKIDEIMAGGALVDELSDGTTPLLEASIHGSKLGVSKLLSYGADPNLKLHRRDAPITVLARRGDIEGVKLLLEHDADVNAQFCSSTALHNATIFGFSDIVDVLLSHPEIDLDLQDPGIGFSALHFAVMHDRISIVAKLLELGADPTLKDAVGNSPYDLALTKSDNLAAALIADYQE